MSSGIKLFQWYIFLKNICTFTVDFGYTYDIKYAQNLAGNDFLSYFIISSSLVKKYAAIFGTIFFQ